MSVTLNTKHLSSFISEEEYEAIYPQVEAAHNQLEAKSGPGNDFLGWIKGRRSIAYSNNSAIQISSERGGFPYLPALCGGSFSLRSSSAKALQSRLSH